MGKGKERKSIYIAPFCTKVHTKRSGSAQRGRSVIYDCLVASDNCRGLTVVISAVKQRETVLLEQPGAEHGWEELGVGDVLNERRDDTTRLVVELITEPVRVDVV